MGREVENEPAEITNEGSCSLYAGEEDVTGTCLGLTVCQAPISLNSQNRPRWAHSETPKRASKHFL